MHGLGRDQRVLNSLQVMITRREHGQHLSHAVREARGAEWPAGTRPLSPHAHLLQPLTLVKMSPGHKGGNASPQAHTRKAVSNIGMPVHCTIRHFSWTPSDDPAPFLVPPPSPRKDEGSQTREKLRLFQ